MPTDIIGSISPKKNIQGVLTPQKNISATINDSSLQLTGKLSNTTLRGYSAYDVAVLYGGFEGTEEEWLASLKGETGETGADGTSVDVEIVSNTENEYILRFIAGDYSFTTPNLKAVIETIDYEDINNKPQIESIPLTGDKSFSDLGIEPIDTDDLLEILN